MSTVKVQEVLRRYHLKPSERDLQPRLNQFTESVLRDQLGDVLAESGINASELVCIKQLRLEMHYSSNKSDVEISELWRKALLKSVNQQLGSLYRGDLIRYPSEIEAVKSLARSLSVGQIKHQWAWRQLGITDGKSADLPRVKDQWVAYLTTHPRLLLPVFKGLLTEGTFIKLLERKVLGARELIKLTDTACNFLLIDINWRSISEQHYVLQTPIVLQEQRSELNKLERKKSTSDLVNLLIQTLQLTFDVEFAQRAVMTNTQRESKIAMTKLLFWAVLAPGREELNVTRSTTKAIEGKLSDLWQVVNVELANLTKGEQSELGSIDNIYSSETLDLRARSKSQIDKEFYSDDELIGGDQISRQSLSSQFGGLLFLLNKLEQEDVLNQLEHVQIAHHSLSWRLENLCWLMLPECKGDASVKVFSGRLFENYQQDAEDEIDKAISHQEEQLLVGIADEFKQKIVAALSIYSRSKNPDKNKLFAQLCRRKARIEAQPGWVNVFYELDSVDTTVRAMGLDINPDYLPWLAYVVKFYYE